MPNNEKPDVGKDGQMGKGEKGSFGTLFVTRYRWGCSLAVYWCTLDEILPHVAFSSLLWVSTGIELTDHRDHTRSISKAVFKSTRVSDFIILPH